MWVEGVYAPLRDGGCTQYVYLEISVEPGIGRFESASFLLFLQFVKANANNLLRISVEHDNFIKLEGYLQL